MADMGAGGQSVGRRAHALLLSRELKGFQVSFWARLGLLVFMLFGHWGSHHSRWELYVVTGSIAGAIAAVVGMLVLLARGRALPVAGYVGLTLDAFVMAMLPWIWYNSVGGYATVPSVYLLKTTLPFWAFVLLVANALATRRRFIVAFVVLFVVVWEVQVLIVESDPRTVRTSDFRTLLIGEGYHPSVHHMAVGAIIAAGAFLTFLAREFRRSVHDAVRLEVKSNQMERYFSPLVAQRLETEDSLLADRRVQAAVMFTDIRGFTATSQDLPPEEVMRLLREYHARMVDVIFANDGTLDKFLGDGLLAVFGVPDQSSGDTVNAVRAALEMDRRLSQWNAERERAGLTRVAHGIGIHSGPVVAGNVGTDRRLEYTVIGDTVNTASRVQGECARQGISLLVTRSVAEAAASAAEFVSVGAAELKGKREAVELFAVRAAADRGRAC